MVMERIRTGRGRLADISVVVAVCYNIAPGLSWPPKMTSICPLGTSAVSPITSLLDNFSDELMKMLPTKIPIAQ